MFIIFAAALSAVVFAFRLSYSDFYADAQREFAIPALAEGFVPQGFEYCDECSLFLVSGYIANSEAARICVMEPDGAYRMATIFDESGNELYIHSGGIASSGAYIYLAGCDGKCYVLAGKELLQSRADSVHVIGRFQTNNAATFCFISDGDLCIGEYYYNVKYDTEETHHLLTPCGDSNNAVITCFPLDEAQQLGVSTVPDKVISITGRIQGGCADDNGTMILSASSVFQGSQLYFYDFASAVKEPSDQFAIGDNEIPLCYLDTDNLLDTIEILPKAEGITICNGRIYMLFESASRRFQFGKLFSAQHVYSLPVQ